MSKRCRFNIAPDPSANVVHCGWLTAFQDEAGDRIPAWVHSAGMTAQQRFAQNIVDAETCEMCPAFEREIKGP